MVLFVFYSFAFRHSNGVECNGFRVMLIRDTFSPDTFIAEDSGMHGKN